MRVPLAGILLLVLGAGCAPRACRSPQVREVLEDRIPIAEKRWSGVLLEFGSPRALPFLGEKGWSYGEHAADGRTFRWAVSESASFRFEIEREGAHLSFFECEPFQYPGSPAQSLGVVANGAELSPIELRRGRNRYPIQLPLVRGENRIELRFRYAGEPNRSPKGKPDKRRLAAAFYRFEIPFEDWSARVGPFEWVEPAKGVFVPSEGELSFFLELPVGARLRLAVGAEDPIQLRAPIGARVTATLSSETGEIWKETFEVRGAAGVWERDLPAASGSPVGLTFRSEGGDLLLHPELFVPRVEVTPEAHSAPVERPNVALIVLDGANALRMGLYGGEENVTPVLDDFARESVVFDVAVTQAVYTIASVGSLLTGQYPERHQSVSFADRLRDDVVTFPGILTRAGYRTAAFPGNAVVSRTFGLDRGYAEFFPVWERKDYSGHGDSVVSAFGDWLPSVSGDPFFAYIHFREPHFPYDPPPPYDTRFGPSEPYPQGIADTAMVDEINATEPPLPAETLARVRGLYHGNLAYADAMVGEILRMLDPETIVIVTADHGEALFEHGFLGHNTQLYEESIRVPLLIRAPGLAPKRVSDLVELIDLAPTILDLTGVSADAGFQGRSLVPYFSAGADSKPKLAFSRTLWVKPRYAVRGSRFKLIWDSRTGERELYDLESDPGERENLEGDEPIREGYLFQELFRWYAEQERLKSETPPPDEALISEEQLLMLEALDYAEHLPPNKKEEVRR
ncbi:MAG: sulfatase family protein [Vicinamibacteria bacterium]